MSQPIELFAWPTPNGHKISIMLEECGLPYVVKPVDITKGEQHKEWFRTLNPNGKMPVIIDPEGPDGNPITIFESGAILGYLGEKAGQFFPHDMRERVKVIEWLMWQMAGFGPMLGQAHHFRDYAPETVPYAIKRYTREAQRLYEVLEGRLSGEPYMAGKTYTIADIATYPWARLYEKQGVDISELKNVRRWLDEISERPAVQKGLDFMKEYEREEGEDFTEEERKALFGT